MQMLDVPKHLTWVAPSQQMIKELFNHKMIRLLEFISLWYRPCHSKAKMAGWARFTTFRLCRSLGCTSFQGPDPQCEQGVLRSQSDATGRASLSVNVGEPQRHLTRPHKKPGPNSDWCPSLPFLFLVGLFWSGGFPY